MVVVLPAPFGPRKPNASPSVDGEVEVDDAAMGAVGLGQPIKLDGRGHGGGHVGLP